ncbi:MAG: chorismate synthase [Bacilli bacterium]|nr:chorismate synthase [Bacilli bacterium]
MNSFGKYLRITIFGASHEDYIGLTVDGYPAGIFLDENLIREKLQLRRGLVGLTSKRYEEDDYRIISGVFNGITTGAPLTFLVPNCDVDSAPYEERYGLARPSHADYTYYCKYQGSADYRGGGVASGRLTVVLVILGALCEQLITAKNIIIAARLKSLADTTDSDLTLTEATLRTFNNEKMPVYSASVKNKMLDKITLLQETGDSCGGVVETYIANLPVGLGNPFFDGVESLIAHLIFSIPGVKGIEFGAGFKIATMLGSEANDAMSYESGRLVYHSNHAGGINGGLTNGALIVFSTAFRPTPSISIEQSTVNFINKTNQKIKCTGRHDTVIAIKGLHVVKALAAYSIAELMIKEGLL